MSNPEAFQQLITLSLAHAVTVMQIELDPDDKNFPKLLSAKSAVMSAVLSASTKVGDSTLRKQSTDKIGALLEEVKRAETLRELMG